MYGLYIMQISGILALEAERIYRKFRKLISDPVTTYEDILE